MAAQASALFGNVATRDYLGFWADQTLNARSVAEFLDLKKSDIAHLAEVAPASVRFDQKIPREVLERLEEIANICSLVAQYFEGDARKTALWFKTRNLMLGDITPRDMIRHGRYEKLRAFVARALAENAAAAQGAESAAGAGESGEEEESRERPRVAQKASAAT